MTSVIELLWISYRVCPHVSLVANQLANPTFFFHPAEHAGDGEVGDAEFGGEGLLCDTKTTKTVGPIEQEFVQSYNVDWLTARHRTAS
jgi:hypothetical protein